MTGTPQQIGAISWTDLTIENAEDVREFYQQVVGWTSDPVDMNGYQDHCMKSQAGDVVAGICHARGENASLPPAWLVYITVEDLEQSIEKCNSLGGTVINGPRIIGGGKCAVIQDPSGAVCALYQPLK